MRATTKILFIIFGCFLSILTMGDNSMIIPNGDLVFGSGQGLYKLNLKSCKMNELYHDNLSVFDKVSKVDENKFLFLQDGPPDISIKMFDLKNHTIDLIYKGATSPCYNAHNKKIIFNYIPTYKEGPFIYSADLNNNIISKIKKVSVGSSYANSIGVISVSPDEVVFNYSESKNSIHMYNMVTGVLKNLPIQDCDFPQIWRSKTKQLMCYDPKNQNYFLTDLSGKKIEKMKTPASFLPVLYLEKYDELLFTITSFPEKDHLGIYDFKTGDSKILCDNIGLGTGDAAYYGS